MKLTVLALLTLLGLASKCQAANVWTPVNPTQLEISMARAADLLLRKHGSGLTVTVAESETRAQSALEANLNSIPGRLLQNTAGNEARIQGESIFYAVAEPLPQSEIVGGIAHSFSVVAVSSTPAILTSLNRIIRCQDGSSSSIGQIPPFGGRSVPVSAVESTCSQAILMQRLAATGCALATTRGNGKYCSAVLWGVEAVFEERGLLPWHDFAEGPDWFGTGAWRAYLESMAAGGMNRLLLHNYNSDNHRGYGVQPIVWYGSESAIGSGDSVLEAYPAWQWTTLDGADHPAGNGAGQPRNASSLDGGSDRLFTSDCFGSPLQTGRSDRCPYPKPDDTTAQLDVFQEAAGFFRSAVMEPAMSMGIRVAIAVGVPLSLPGPQPGPSPPSAPFSTISQSYCANLPFDYTGNETNDACRALCISKNCSCYDHGIPPSPEEPNGFACRMTNLGNETHSSGWNYTAYPRPVEQPVSPNASIVAGYRGTLTRMRQVYGTEAIDMVVLWAQIQGTSSDWQAVAEELELAQQAAIEIGWTDLRLATGGWELGPKDDLTFINQVAVANVSMMQLLEGEGTVDVDVPSFTKLHDSNRSAWTIPWLEGDLALLGSQLWVQRIQRQAQQSVQAGANGNLAIHWRTAQAAPQLLALQGQSWRITRASSPSAASAEQLYEEYARQAFDLTDSSLVQAAAEALVQLDSNGSWTSTAVPWASFGLEADCPTSQEALNGKFAFINASLIPLLAQMHGHPTAERGVSYWIGVFDAAYHTLSLCMLTEQFKAIETKILAAAPPDRPNIAQQIGLPALQAISAEYDGAIKSAMATLETTGDLGVISEIGTHTYFVGPDKAARFLQAYVTVPESAMPSKSFTGQVRVAALEHSSTVAKGSPYVASITAVVPTAATIVDSTICWQADGLDDASWTCSPLKRVVADADVFQASLADPGTSILAYANITCLTQAGQVEAHVLPAAAPADVWHIQWQ